MWIDMTCGVNGTVSIAKVFETVGEIRLAARLCVKITTTR